MKPNQTLYKKQEVYRITSPVGLPSVPRMPEPVRFQRVMQLVEEGAQLVEVLPREEYGEQHLPGAISLPLKELDADAVAGLSRDKAAIVYCWDSI